MDAGCAVLSCSHHLGDARPQLSGDAQLGDRHELVVVSCIAETDLPQRICGGHSAVGEHTQVGDRRGDRSGEFPGSARTEVVERGTVDGDRPHSAGVAGELADGGQ